MGGCQYILKFFLLPLGSSVNWFSTAYILIVLLLPVINPFLSKLSKKNFLLLLLFVNIFWYGFGFVLSVPFYDLMIAFFYYACGVFYKRFFNEKTDKKILLFIICLILWLFATALSYFRFYLLTEEKTLYALFIFVVLRNLCVPLFAFCIFRFFLSLEIGENKIINKISSATFAVYLIHGSVFQRFLWDNIFKINSVQYKSLYFPLLCVLDTLCIFIVCIFIDFGRQYINKKLRTTNEKNNLHI